MTDTTTTIMMYIDICVVKSQAWKVFKKLKRGGRTSWENIWKVKWSKFLTLCIWYQRGRDGWLWQGDAGGSKCQINHFYWPLPPENVDLCSSSLLITHHKSAIHGCVWICVFSVLKDKEGESKSNTKCLSIYRRCRDDMVQVSLVVRRQFGHICFWKNLLI